MLLGIVRGSIFATIQHDFYRGRRILIVDQTTPEWKPTGKYIIAVDTVEAGPGDHVLILDEGNGARQVLNDPSGPIRSVIVGVIDSAQVEPS